VSDLLEQKLTRLRIRESIREILEMSSETDDVQENEHVDENEKDSTDHERIGF